ncbi:hypothetical protein [Maridesulfovibrio bastinii]|uniref:hypothetical protein n=1 Tax=Maridesulfovibrio bastinii TaxID=47157 RepID=UPI000408763A|nr:hypothetical protein [Maridesulfovibrio bastinii]
MQVSGYYNKIHSPYNYRPVGSNADSSGSYSRSSKSSDQIDISEAAMLMYENEKAANSQSQQGVQDENSSSKVISTLETKDGGKIVIEKIADNGEGSGLKMSVYDNKGELQSESELADDMIIKQNDKGEVSIEHYTLGSETSGDDIILAVSGNQVDGGAGDDTIVDLYAVSGLPKSTRHGFDADGMPKKEELYDITGGDGDDHIILAGDNITSRVNTGRGKDKIDALGSMSSSSFIDAGIGNDEINLSKDSTLSADLGDGNDKIKSVASALRGNIDTGEGNDSVEASSFDGSLVMGGGEDEINVKGSASGKFDTGRGNDKILVEGLLSTGEPENGKTIETGSGDDYIKAGVINSGYIMTGRGDDELRADKITGGEIFTGAGKDYVQSNEITDGELFTGADEDNVMVLGEYSGKYMSTGRGDDIVQAGKLSSGNVVTSYGEDIVKSYGDISAKVETGDELDKVYANGEVDKDNFNTGEGEDIFDVEGFRSSKQDKKKEEEDEEERKKKVMSMFKTGQDVYRKNSLGAADSGIREWSIYL